MINKKEKNEYEINYNKNKKEDQDIKFKNKVILNDNYNNIEYTKEKIINERISFFKNKCVDSLKEEKYEKAYNYLIKIKKKKDNENDNEVNNRDIREHLIKILGKDNIGYWHLIDQIILFEDMLIK